MKAQKIPLCLACLSPRDNLDAVKCLATFLRGALIDRGVTGDTESEDYYRGLTTCFNLLLDRLSMQMGELPPSWEPDEMSQAEADGGKVGTVGE